MDKEGRKDLRHKTNRPCSWSSKHILGTEKCNYKEQIIMAYCELKKLRIFARLKILKDLKESLIVA